GMVGSLVGRVVDDWRGSHGTSFPRRSHRSRTAACSGCRVTATHRSSALPPAPQAKQCHTPLLRWATNARLVRDRDRCTGHGPRTCPSQQRRPWKPTNSRTSARRSRARVARKSMPGIARLLAGQRRGVRTGSTRAAPETLLIERFALAEHVVARPPQPRRQDRQRLALAALGRLLLSPLLSPLTGAQKQTSRLGEGPAQMGVADLLAAGAKLLASRLVHATHQPGVRQK